MYSPLTPILAADSPSHKDTAEIQARVEALAVVLATVSRLADTPDRPLFDALACQAELGAALASATPTMAAVAAHELDTLGVQLQAGLLALEKARKAARLNRAAAVLLYRESFESYRATLANMGYPIAH